MSADEPEGTGGEEPRKPGGYRLEERIWSLFENMQETFAFDELVTGEGGAPEDWIIHDVNAAYEKAFNLPRDKVAGRRASAVYGRLHVDSFLPLLSRVVYEGRPDRYDLYLPEIDRFFVVSAFPLGGTCFGTLGLDMTEYRRTARDRERFLVELQTIFAAVPDPLFTYNMHGRIERVNPATYEACGFDPVNLDRAGLLSRLEMCHADGRPLQVEELPSYRAFRGATIKDERIRLRPVQGEEKTVLCSASPLEIGGGIFGAVVLWRDITDHERLLDEVQRRMAELDAIINAIADAVIIYNSKGEILRMNPAAIKLLGYDPEEARRSIEGRAEALHVETAEGESFPMVDAMRRVLQGETMQGLILSLQKGEGKKSWISASAAPIFTPSGRIIGAVGTGVDISRVRELQEEREVYLHTISHDLRSPLTVIQGHAELIGAAIGEDPPLGIDVAESVEAILQGTKGMSDMIDALLDTAYLESGQMRLKTEPVDLRSFVENYLRRSEIALDRERITFHIPPGFPPVQADPLRLERILANLLTNAVKYSPPATPVRVEVREDGTQVRICVIDEGPGIDPGDMPHIFERFYRVKKERKGKGIGLGLYISRLLVEAHGGRIGVECGPGGGCIFSFTLPRVETEGLYNENTGFL